MEQSNKEHYTYRNLDVWQQARSLTREVLAVVQALPRTMPAEVMAKQITRSVTSIGANIAEGHGRFSFAAFRNHLLIARGSATETDNWFATLLDAGFIDAATEERLHADCQRLVASLTNRIRSLANQMKTPGQAVREESPVYFTSDGTIRDDDLFDSSIVQMPTEDDDDNIR